MGIQYQSQAQPDNLKLRNINLVYILFIIIEKNLKL